MATYRNYKTSRILPTILAIVVIIVVIVALVSIARALFFSGNSTNEVVVDTTRESLLDTSANSAVSMTVRGPIVANENFRSYRIVISPNSRQLQTYTGYLDQVLSDDTLANNTAAYDQFVHALDLANYTKGVQFADEKNDVRGICATGRVYEFRILKDNVPVEMLWTSTCKGSTGSLQASVEQISALYTNQIPDANSVIRKLAL